MGANTKIEWCDHSWNPWIGCTMVSPGCGNCYAAQQDKFRRWTPEGWGKGKPRRRTSKANWGEPVKWDKSAAKEAAHYADALKVWKTEENMEIRGFSKPTRPRVFCASLADWQRHSCWFYPGAEEGRGG